MGSSQYPQLQHERTGLVRPGISSSYAINFLNPCFNVYHITDYCPLLFNPEIPYFNLPDVQAAINASVGAV